MQVGTSVYLKTSPECRGVVSRKEGDRFQVTWNPYTVDRPEVMSEKMGVNLREASKRTRVWYSELGNIGLGTP